jgi:hypothetical protein
LETLQSKFTAADLKSFSVASELAQVTRAAPALAASVLRVSRAESGETDESFSKLDAGLRLCIRARSERGAGSKNKKKLKNIYINLYCTSL